MEGPKDLNPAYRRLWELTNQRCLNVLAYLSLPSPPFPLLSSFLLSPLPPLPPPAPKPARGSGGAL